jgi:hypothetical protein
MKCIATNAAFHTAKEISIAAINIFGNPKKVTPISMAVSTERMMKIFM